MKSTTERRLLLALLVSSLVPLLALALLSTAAVERMGREIEEQSAESNRARLRTAHVARCLQVAERVSSFLRRREADLRALALLPRTRERYVAFSRNTLAPVRTLGPDGERVRIWVPLYSRVWFADTAGKSDPVAHLDEKLPTSEPHIDSASEKNPAPLAAILASPPGTAWAAPVAPPGLAPMSPFSGALHFAMTVRDGRGKPEGAVNLVLDPRHLEHRVLDPDPLGDQIPSPNGMRWTLFYANDGTPLLYPSPAGGLGARWDGFVDAHLPEVAARVRDGMFGVLGLTSEVPDRSLAYAPLFLDTGPDRTPDSIGAVLLYTEVAPATAGTGAAGFLSLTRGTELRIGILTVASTLGVALSAFLVARRMGRPWRRLREKAQAVHPLDDRMAYMDEVDEIARSFDSLASQVVTSAGRLRASEERLREFFEMNPDGIAVMDAEGHLLHFNRSLCQILRRTPAELGATNPETLYAHPKDRDQLLSRLRAKGRLRNYEVDLVRGDGTAFPALLTLRLADWDGKECIDAVVRDISDLVAVQRKDREKTEALFHVYGELSRAHQELREAYAEVEEKVRLQTAELRTAYEALQTSDRAKTEFLMKMSHELRTPLNCIIGYSEAMIDGLDGRVTSEQARSLHRIAQSGRRLLRMIENLLDLSRLEAGRMDVLCGAIPLEEAIEDVLHQARSLVGDRPVRLEIGLQEPLPAVWVDPDRIRQVLFNLVGNAVKFTEEGQVRIEARQLDPRYVEVRVSDTGPGIGSEHLESIFDKFAQAPGRNRSGAGLGLSICRELVENMGGTIRAESTLGEGSAFVLKLPVAGRTGQLSLPLGPQGDG